MRSTLTQAWRNRWGRLAILLIATGLVAMITRYMTGYLLLLMLTPDQLGDVERAQLWPLTR